VEITSLGYRTDLALLGLSGSLLTDEGEYVVVRTPANPGFWWGNYLLFRKPFGPGDTATRLEIFRHTFPDAKHVAFGIDSVDGVAGAEDELLAAGFEIERNTVMTASSVLAPARPNTDSEYRLLATDDDWEQQVGLTLAASPRDVDGYEEFNRRKIEAERHLVDSGDAKWFGAFEGEQLQASLGLVLDGSGGARFQIVQTHPDARGRGIASTLVYRASTYGLTEFRARTLVMVADPEYLAIRLYRALGFADTETQLQVTRPAP
jgi:GNAT superfamily N-acetyltransferase